MKRLAVLGLVVFVACLLWASRPVDAALWIDRVSDSGATLVLSDDSAWEVHMLDQARASIWLPMQRVTIAKGERTGEYLIIRLNQRDSVRATLVR